VSIALYAIAAACSLLAWYVRGRQREYLPIAAFFAVWFASDAILGAYNIAVLGPLWVHLRGSAPRALGDLVAV
jgi:hypothetical protein